MVLKNWITRPNNETSATLKSLNITYLQCYVRFSEWCGWCLLVLVVPFSFWQSYIYFFENNIIKYCDILYYFVISSLNIINIKLKVSYLASNPTYIRHASIRNLIKSFISSIFYEKKYLMIFYYILTWIILVLQY